ncbi:MAG: thiamine pyrophosphate-binding protein [Pseudomonadota bacterium]
MDSGETADTETVGAFIARWLAEIGVRTAFGVISIHNMPILDAIAQAGLIRFVPARGEAGAMNMADAYARVSGGLGVCITSTGTAAGNAAGAQAEALTAGSRVLHITAQVDLAFADRDRGAIHDVPRQPQMLGGVSKAIYRIWDGGGALGVLTAAASAALSPPSGPVSLEVPIDVQRQPMPTRAVGTGRAARPTPLHAPTIMAPRATDAAIAALTEMVRSASRPLLWLGGGARGATAPAQALVAKGFGAVSSTHGRAVVPEDHPATLGAFNMTPEAAALYQSCDLMIVAGSRLRGNETRNNRLPLPRPLVQIDAEASQGGRNYPVDLFVHGEAADALARLNAALPALDTDPALPFDIARARAEGEGRLRAQLGPYAEIADRLSERVSAGSHPWVRDVTIANSTFGNRFVRIAAPHLGVHALGGGIGQGLAMAIGAALAQPNPKTVALVGDGGLMLGLAELMTVVEEQAPLVLVLMNDKGYGVIRNIQDAQYGGRHAYASPAIPDFAGLCAAMGLAHRPVRQVAAFAQTLDAALALAEPVLIEIDMTAIGPFAEPFAGPPAGAAQRS